jgi:hypothetical protein
MLVGEVVLEAFSRRRKPGYNESQQFIKLPMT